MQLVCPSDLLKDLPIGSTAEISRFAISKERRSGLSDGLMRLGLVQGLVRLSREIGTTHWCAIMEPTLLRLLRRDSIQFHSLGPLVDYHGLRQPCFRGLTELLDSIGSEQPRIWEFLTQADASPSTIAAPNRPLDVSAELLAGSRRFRSTWRSNYQPRRTAI
jgi:hypothetical protein